MKRKREARREAAAAGRAERQRRRCEGRLGRHLPTARSVTETAVGDAPDGGCCAVFAAAARLISLFHSLSLSLSLPLSLFVWTAPGSNAIRTLRILNSKLQNMLSGRYKSKVGPRGVRDSFIRRLRRPDSTAAGVRALRVLRKRGPPEMQGATPITNRGTRESSFLRFSFSSPFSFAPFFSP